MVAAVWKSKPQLEKLSFITNKTGDLQLKSFERKIPNAKILKPKFKVKIQREEDRLKLQLPRSNYTTSTENQQPLHGEQTYWPAKVTLSPRRSDLEHTGSSLWC